jgi:hypothetical protein
MSRQALGNVLAGVLFLIVAIYDFTQDDSSACASLGQVLAAELQGLLETGATGLEPATSGVTGRRSNQLNYAPVTDGF